MEKSQCYTQKECDKTNKKLIQLFYDTKTDFKLQVHKPIISSEEGAKVRNVSIKTNAKAILLKNKEKDEVQKAKN